MLIAESVYCEMGGAMSDPATTNVYRKLAIARVRLLDMGISKSGRNEHAGFGYYELEDFLPHTLRIFNELGLLGAISFEAGMARLTIVDCDRPDDKIIFSCELAACTLPRCQPMQNIGAAHTYARRYLWIDALEILEADALDAEVGRPNLARADNPGPISPSWESEARGAAQLGLGFYKEWFMRQPTQLRREISNHSLHAELKKLAAEVEVGRQPAG